MPDEPTNSTTPENTNSADTGVLGGTPATPEPKAENLLGSKPDEKAADKAPDPTPEVKYEFKDVPDGYDAKELEAFAKEHKIAPEAAQKILEREAGAVKALQEKMQSTFDSLASEGWIKELKADPVIGGKNWEASVNQIRRANDLLSPELRKQISDAKLQNSPILVKAMFEIGAKLKEDSFVRANQSGEQEKKKDFGVFYA